MGKDPPLMGAWLVEVTIGSLTYCFDRAPSSSGGPEDDDRVVVVWGRSSAPAAERDRSRLRGFLPGAGGWLEGEGQDRGHLVAHAAGGGLDLNLIPQARGLNRGRTADGRRWRRFERCAAQQPGLPLFVRPIYDSGSWTASWLEYGIVLSAELRVERVRNQD